LKKVEFYGGDFLKKFVKKMIKIVPKKNTCLNTRKSSGCNLPHPRELSNGSKSTKRGAAGCGLGDFSATKKKKKKTKQNKTKQPKGSDG
jgi:hypothetical protein